MKPNVKPLAIVMISLFGFLIIVTHYSQNSQLSLTGREMQAKVLSTDYMIDSSQLKTLPGAAVIDLSVNRSSRGDGLPNWYSIPLSSILDEAYVAVLSGSAAKVLISNDPIKAHEAWMLLTQMGYEQLYVLDSSKKRLVSEVP